MQAETAYNVIQSLSDSEKKRLFQMIAIEPKSKPTISNNDAEIREMIIKRFQKWRHSKR
jgi:DNA-directed RNA polymerase subunit H (RpoH/RPB5)